MFSGFPFWRTPLLGGPFQTNATQIGSSAPICALEMQKKLATTTFSFTFVKVCCSCDSDVSMNLPPQTHITLRQSSGTESISMPLDFPGSWRWRSMVLPSYERIYPTCFIKENYRIPINNNSNHRILKDMFFHMKN